MANFNDELKATVDKGYVIKKKLIHCNPEEKATRLANTCFISAGNQLTTIFQKLPLLKTIPSDEIPKLQAQLSEHLTECRALLDGAEHNYKDLKEDPEFNNVPEKNILTKEEHKELTDAHLSQQMGAKVSS